MAASKGFTLNIREVDIERGLQDDLTKANIWASILEEIRTGKYLVLVLSPPCGAWSRVRFQWLTSPGPRPLRNKAYPWGFPWLSDVHHEQVKRANLFVEQCLEAAVCVAALGGFYIIEHPEGLGAVKEEHPASVWQLPEMRQPHITPPLLTPPFARRRRRERPTLHIVLGDTLLILRSSNRHACPPRSVSSHGTNARKVWAEGPNCGL